MIGVQWCDECDAPRFKWSCGGIHEVPRNCYYQTDHTVALRFVAESLREARRKLATFAHGSVTGSPNSSARSRRRTYVRERFDQVIGWWARQPTIPKELRLLLREYNDRAANRQETGSGAASAGSSNAENLLDVALLHSLTEEMKALAEQERSREKPAAAVPTVPRPGSWRMVPRPQSKTDAS